jgi:hypothetical protein
MGISTRFIQMGKYRDIYESLHRWRQELPPYLDWDRRNSALPTYLKLQRPYLEVQFRSAEMRINLSIAHLGPLMLSKPSTWDIESAYSDALKAVQRIFDMIESQETSQASCSHFLHWDTIRATATLLQIFTRSDFLDGQSLDEIITTCRRGLEASRKLLAGSLTKLEETMEATFEK